MSKYILEEAVSSHLSGTVDSGSGDETLPPLLPVLVYEEVIEALRPPRVFDQVVTIDRSLVGETGVKIRVPTATSLSATSATESTIDTSGYSTSTKTIGDIDLDIGNVIYAAVALSDVLMEDMPNIEWVRLMVRNMAEAVLQYQDGAVRDALIAGAGNTVAAATAATLDFDDVVDAIATMETAHLYPEPAAQFVLVAHPNNSKDIVKDTRFYDTKRYALGGIPFPAGEVGGLTAGCRVLVSSNMIQGLALVIAPPSHSKAPFAIKAIKRPLTLKSERDEVYARQFMVTSMRYGTAITRSAGVYLISNC